MLTPSRTPLHRPAGRLLAVSLLAVTALAGCSTKTSLEVTSRADEPRSATPSPSAEASTPATDPSPSPTLVETETATPTAAPATLADRLLPGADLPGLDDGFVWSDGATTAKESDSTGGLLRCQRFTMLDIGAEKVAQRRYDPPAGSDDAGPPEAAELVADFPDEQTARSAVEVLRSWHRPCDDRLGSYERHEVGPLEPVSVPDAADADAAWYLLKYGPPSGDPSSLWFDAEGFVRVGDRVALVTMTDLGQTYDYPAGQEPLVEALRTAAGRL